jgi:hypothetical protein
MDYLLFDRRHAMWNGNAAYKREQGGIPVMPVRITDNQTSSKFDMPVGHAGGNEKQRKLA